MECCSFGCGRHRVTLPGRQSSLSAKQSNLGAWWQTRSGSACGDDPGPSGASPRAPVRAVGRVAGHNRGVSNLVLRTFQSLARVTQLHRDGVLLGDWAHVLPGTERGYRRLVEVMEDKGIPTAGRPPVWAWHGRVRLVDADLLFDATQELSRGFATITFQAPEHLVLLSDYGHWSDVMLSDEVSLRQWQPRRRTPSSDRLEQACLPYLTLAWVTKIEPLPTTGWDTLDLDNEL